ncbi:MAG: outer membrane beta-barrel protein [Bacteroidota bacterium]|nr:outer membrane beta-barrel protein [Bacteroidota bacterium]
MKTQARIIKHLTLLLPALLIFFGQNIATAQQDTTRIEIGGLEFIIVEKIKRMEEGISNLEKGKRTFEKEIAKAEANIAEAEKNIAANERKLNENPTEEETKIIESKIERQERIIVENEKKIEAFSDGMKEIDAGIVELEDELSDMGDELDDDLGNLDKDIDDDISKSIEKHKKGKKYNGHWAGFEFGLTNFMNTNNQLATNSERGFMELNPEKSFGFAVNFMEFNIPVFYRTFGFTTGLGATWNHFNLAQNVDIYENEAGVMTAMQVDPAVREYDRNNLNMAYLTIPVIAELQIPMGKEKLYLGAGLIGGVRMWSKLKQKYEIDGNKFKDKTRDDFQLSPFRYGATLRAGYGKIGLFANYDASPLFKENTGPELYPFSVGLRIINF